MAWWMWNQRDCDAAKEGTKSRGGETSAADVERPECKKFAKDVDVAMFIENNNKMDKFLEIQREILELKKAKLDMKKKMFEVDMLLKEDEIMKVSPNDGFLLVGRYRFFRALQKHITEKYEAKK